MFDTLVYYGIPIVLGVSAALLVTVIVGKLLPKKDTLRMGGFPPRPPEPVEDGDDIGGSFTCYFCDASYDSGAKECICYGCNRYVCLDCTDYEEGRSPCGLHTAADHPAIDLKFRMKD